MAFLQLPDKVRK